mmetsp:Transcript_29606/g.28830  ORF Transcript_29606/g.28830 Transcript_29606/m.28830 type:complete len:197 (+) Transcript_29606:1364-1954(+)
MALFATSINTYICTIKTKPFNALLGETYEYVDDKYEFLSEQVSHHPPCTVYYCRSKFGWTQWKDTRGKVQFNLKNLNIIPNFPWHVSFDNMGPNGVGDELYEMTMPLMSAHNLIIGQTYLDLHGKCSVRNLTRNETCIINFHKRSWSGANAFNLSGEIRNAAGELAFKVEGNFSDKVYVIDCTGPEEVKEYYYQKF